MSEIEKMYENAGILKECLSPCYINKSWRKTHDCPNCDNRENYPPFTAEKQLELINWLARRTHITVGLGLPWGQYDDDWWTVTNKKGDIGTDKYKLEEAIAKLTNNLWQDLTDTEREEIRKILKGEK